ncbi:MAG TPA: arginine--tRNA ligase [Thermomicrobiales bacterium]|nr:arginine--tRNA ligase [Thermomicrobiales bacterium]
MFRTYEYHAAATINDIISEMGFRRREFEMRAIPFSGSWGTSSSIAFALANEASAEEPAVKDESLSKKERKAFQQSRVREKATDLAEQIAASLQQRPEYARVEAVNGYINIYFDTNQVANQVLGTVIGEGTNYGRGTPQTDKVMIEYSQPNTHKEFHVGHLRNTCLGEALARITAFAGYETVRSTYPGDIGLHVIRTLWCYTAFHAEEAATIPPDQRGRWLGGLYTEAVRRLEYRDEVVGLLNELAKMDAGFSAMIDRMSKDLYKAGAPGEDVAYLLGQIANQREIKTDALYDDMTIARFWPIVGQQLEDELDLIRREGPQQAPPVPSHSGGPPVIPPLVTLEDTAERHARWQRLGEHLNWWPHVPGWQQEVRDTFQRWEREEPEFMTLWQETRQWSLDGFERIWQELGVHFDVYFFESQVEAEGREIVRDLLERGIAEVSDGLPVVKIDEKLGLEKETYRTMPVLRSDGTTLYATKDLALTKRKFEDHGIDRSVWVIDVRQALYMQQIFKIMELLGFEQAEKCYHLGYEVVTLPEGAMSSRKGNVILYDDLAREAKARARDIIEEKAKQAHLTGAEKDKIAEQVGIGSIIYAMLARDNNRVIVFDMDEALSFDGHAAPYIQYAHARACRILERVEEMPSGELVFDNLQPEEIDLIQQIGNFPSEVQRAAAEYKPLLIATWVYDLARHFNDFYADIEKRPVLTAPEPARSMRIALVDATRQALANGLALLGVAAPEAM